MLSVLDILRSLSLTASPLHVINPEEYQHSGKPQPITACSEMFVMA